ncbi:splicing factor 3B subunit 1 [Thecamonas trahens ATCC 50062]|uniref:Splicing factor 3B subunit 1 n=1 Tax=Thecamonas trahens ATCC 50062 TaxID=461836 RepID=A0A0L0DN87_THETB|nr:splicing factor 3B subunit 1 [Thecamonas trahens ATCC 50062]KNC52878.1 splicing factor 3B subunit 1 [Thecamonas trahens ATCC 50062]|eukprot:XP_013754977.1 splicing factor 3B subunit 1 [Thecamonas trahens ATCC 50062]
MSSSDEDMEVTRTTAVHVPTTLAAASAAAAAAAKDTAAAAVAAAEATAGASVRAAGKAKETRSYALVLQEAKLARADAQIRARVAEIERAQAAAEITGSTPPSVEPTAATPSTSSVASSAEPPQGRSRKRTRWGARTEAASGGQETVAGTAASAAGDDAVAPAAKRRKVSRWDVASDGEDEAKTGPGGKAGAKATQPASAAGGVGSTWTDAQLDALLPQGFAIVEPPAGYVEQHPGALATSRTRAPGSGAVSGEDAYVMPAAEGTVSLEAYGVQPGMVADAERSGVHSLKPDDYEYFAPILGKDAEAEDASSLSTDEQKERKVLRLLLKIKNGLPSQRKVALRTITDKANELGASALFGQILPLFLAPSLEDAERHLLVKVVDRVLYKLKSAVRPFVHKILVVIEPMLVDEDPYARVEGREVISNLAKAAGLTSMVANMRQDIDHADHVVRDVTARAFAVVGVALGVPLLIPLLEAVVASQTWQARHTGVKIVQQLAILQGVGILPHLQSLVAIVAPQVTDVKPSVSNMAANALAALAEASAPYGIDAFDPVVEPLWEGIKIHSGRTLAAFLKAIGFIIPLMEPAHANHYTREVMVVLVKHFSTVLDDMKLVVLKVVEQVIGADGVPADYVTAEVLPEFFAHMWVRRNALDARCARQLEDTTVALAVKVGGAPILTRLIEYIRDDSEPFRRTAVLTVTKVVEACGVADVDVRLEERVLDALVLAFQDQSTQDVVFLRGLAAFVNALGVRVKPYLQPIFTAVKWRLNNAMPHVREYAADLVAAIAPVVIECDEEVRLARMAVVFYENLGEEFPEVLGSILGALSAIVSVIGMTKMTPPIRDLLPRLTPILRNRHEKVQENCIRLVGRIADRGARFVSGREWMRICFDLLDLLKATRKSTRAAAVSTFGFIAKAIGPQDVLATLLANLKVQERQNRVCTTVAIAIVAEACSPFTVLPSLMNEYRVPEINVQNGVLKALSFMFQYIGEMAKDYIYAVAPLLQDALMDKDPVHRQTAATVVQHLALGVYGLSCEDAVLHLLNYVWPNILETSPHVINAVMDAIMASRLALGAPRILMYTLQGLFHPARKVRSAYWRVYNDAYVANPDALVPFYPDLTPLAPQPKPIFPPGCGEGPALPSVTAGPDLYVRSEMEYFL